MGRVTMAKKMTPLCFSTSLLLIITIIVTVVDSKTHFEDIEVLKSVKDGVNPNSIPPGSCLSSWDFSVDPCDSIFSDRFTCGIRCDTVVSGEARVTEITLDPAGYSGSVSSSTWDLPYLQALDISDNSFSGEIPNSFLNLTSLRRLGLSGNLFSCEIPLSIGFVPRLEELYLDSNHFHGEIPASLNGLISLKRIGLQQNNLSGEIPDLGAIKNLEFFDASNNQLSGELPATMPTSLVEVSIRNNNLVGELPSIIKTMKFLQVLDLSHNKLSGEIQSIVFDHPSLQQLSLSDNGFTSIQAPANNGVNSKLIAVDLSQNQLEGLLPVFMAAMPQLSALSLENNKFTGMIPSDYAVKVAVSGKETASFERLFLGGNYLFGAIPGLLLDMEAGKANVSLVDNCLYRCPGSFFFCEGRGQKSLIDCKRFGSLVP